MSTYATSGPVKISIDDGSGKYKEVMGGESINLFCKSLLTVLGTMDVEYENLAGLVPRVPIIDEIHDFKRPKPAPDMPAPTNRKEKRRQAAIARKRAKEMKNGA